MVNAPEAEKLSGVFFCRLAAMKISAQLAIWLCAVFGLICLGAAITAFSGAASIPDVDERQASLGYAAFYGFLALVAAVFGVLSWMMAKGKLGRIE
jgi:hypothetical protein